MMSDEKGDLDDKINQICVKIKGLQSEILDKYQESNHKQIRIFLRQMFQIFNEGICADFICSVQKTAAKLFQRKQLKQVSGLKLNRDSSLDENQGAYEISKLSLGSMVGQFDENLYNRQQQCIFNQGIQEEGNQTLGSFVQNLADDISNPLQQNQEIYQFVKISLENLLSPENVQQHKGQLNLLNQGQLIQKKRKKQKHAQNQCQLNTITNQNSHKQLQQQQQDQHKQQKQKQKVIALIKQNLLTAFKEMQAKLKTFLNQRQLKTIQVYYQRYFQKQKCLSQKSQKKQLLQNQYKQLQTQFYQSPSFLFQDLAFYTKKITNTIRQTQNALLDIQQYLKCLENQINEVFVGKREFIKKQIKFLWFIRMEEKDIKQRIQAVAHQKLDEFKGEVLKLKQIVEDWCRTYQQICKEHRKMVYYMCLNEYEKPRIYLCNNCIAQIKLAGQHKGHQIVCRRHNNTIKYKKNVEENEEQLFLCQSCAIHSGSSQVSFISQCHFEPISKLCTKRQCIKNDEFRICNSCPQKHYHHRQVNLSQAAMMKQFNIEKELSIDSVEEQYNQIRQGLKLNPILKIIDIYLKDILYILRFLESFAVINNTQLSKWVNCVLQEGNKEDMFVLWGVRKLKRDFANEKERKDYLEIFNDLLQIQIQILLKQISELFKQFKRKVQRIAQLGKQEINQKLNQKYRQIIDTQTNSQVVLIPCSLYQIDQNHLDRIEKIVVLKEKEEANDEMMEKQLKDARIRIYNQLQQLPKEIHQKTFPISKKSISSLLDSSFQNFNLYQIENKTDYIKEIHEKKKSLLSINQNFKRRMNECLPIQQIIKLKLTNLKVIRIQYQPKMRVYPRQKYSISAFGLFKVVHLNKLLEQLTLKGVEVQKFVQFTNTLNPLSKNQDAQKNMDQLIWMQDFRPSKTLKLSIDAQVTFYISEHKRDANLSLMSDLEFFKSIFYSISDITVSFRLGQYRLNKQDCILKELWRCLRQIKKIKISIRGVQFKYVNTQLFKFLLLQLSKFTEITQLTFHDLKIKWNDEHSLCALFKNNVVTCLQLYGCLNFPALPIMSTLKSISLSNVSFSYRINFNVLFRDNLSLRQVYCQGIHKFTDQYDWVIEEQLFNRLQTLIIRNCRGISFGKDTNDNPDEPLFWDLGDDHYHTSPLGSSYFQRDTPLHYGNRTTSFKFSRQLPSQKDTNLFGIGNILSETAFNLKQLIIDSSFIKRRDDLYAIFPKLVNLSYISLNNFNFDHSLLCTIPSPDLKELHIYSNDTITDSDLEVIDSKWPYIRKLTLRDCINVTAKIWIICKFKGLISVGQNTIMRYRNTSIRQYLKSRGIVTHLHTK